MDNLQKALEIQNNQGKPQDFEIHVDGVRAVPRTSSFEHFEDFMPLVNAETRSITVILYAGTSNRCNKHIYHFGEDTSLEGVGDLETRFSAKLEEARREWNDQLYIKELVAEKNGLEKELKEAQQYCQDLEQAIEVADKNKWNLGNINIAEFGSIMVENILRRNPKILSKLPMGEALAGAFAEESEPVPDIEQPEEPDNGTASFEPANTSTEEQEAIEFISKVLQSYSEEQVPMVIELVERLASVPEKLPELLSIVSLKST